MTIGPSPTGLRRSLWSMFGGLFIAFGLLIAVAFLMHFYVDYRSERTTRNNNEALNVELARNALAADIAAVTTDLMFLGRLIESLSFDPAVSEGRKRYLAQVFLTFAREKALYDQVRFLDQRGHELVRVNLAGGEPDLVDEAQLQDKSARYYVGQALRLGDGQVYLSPLDLNVEGGEVEQPIKPVLRFATPVFDSEGQRRGLVVLNYLGDRLLAHFREAAANIVDHVQLLNADGYWLSSPRPDEAWGFMFGRELTMARRFPAAWRRITAQTAGQFESDGMLFTFATVRPALESANALSPARVPTAQSDTWKVVSQLRLDTASLGMGPFVARYAGLYIGILGLMAILAFMLANSNVHRRTAEAQRAYEQRFRQTLEDIDLAALMVDVRGRLTFCNHYLLDMTGWQRDEVLGSVWLERFVPEEQRNQVGEVLRRLERYSEVPPHFEGEICTRDGERRLISWNNTVSRDNRGEIIGLTAIGEDVTERRRAEAEVRKLSQAVEQSPAIVVITDRTGRIEYVNAKFRQVTGYTLDEVKGENPRLLKSGETATSEYARMWEALTSGGEWRGEFHNRRKDGSLYWEAALISALRDADGKVTHYIAMKEDITERKRLQQEIDYRNQELAQAQALAAMGQMSTMLAHDLRNPLSSVKMAIQILGKQAQTDEARELAGIGQEQVRYMEDIISDMLTFARPGELSTVWLSADKLINEVIGTVRRRILEYGVTVDTDCAAGLPTFPGDASKLRQLLSNLLVNAFQAVADEPISERRVHIGVDLSEQASGRQVRFRICDNGKGFDPALHDQLFEPFYTSRTRGTGLGLAIVRQIANLHGGTVELKRNDPRGSCAVVLLPMVPATERSPATTQEDEERIA